MGTGSKLEGTMKIIPFGVPFYEKFPAKLRKRLHDHGSGPFVMGALA